MDVALPEHSVVAELLPAITKHAGESLADDGQSHGGWTLRRFDGTDVDPNRSLAAQDILDGEILQLVPRQTEWPELDYDDIVDVIASGARRTARGWAPDATRRTGIAVACAAFLLALGLILLGGIPWTTASYVAIGGAVLTLGCAATLSRVLKDAAAAVPFGVLAMIFGFVGGFLVALRDNPISQASATHYLIGFAGLTLVSLVAYGAIAYRTHWFFAGIFGGLVGALGAWLARWDSLNPMEAAAIVASIVVVLTSTFPLLSIRLAKLPVPTLPTTTEELLADPPAQPLPRVHATVQRADEMLTGFFIGSAAVLLVCQVLLVTSGNTTALYLAWTIIAANLLRARLFPTLRHRIPQLVAACGGVAIVAATALAASNTTRLLVVVPILGVVALGVLALSRYLVENRPTPFMSRVADILDVIVIIVIVPLVCVVIGLYGYLRGLYG